MFGHRRAADSSSEFRQRRFVDPRDRRLVGPVVPLVAFDSRGIEMPIILADS